MFQVIPFQGIPLRRFRRFALAASVASVAVVASAVGWPVAAYAGGAGHGVSLAPPPVREEDRISGDHLTVTVRQAGVRGDGTFEVYCHPGRGNHPDVGRACRAVDRNTRWGRDAFAPVPDGGVCTMRYGGPATAHVTGRWAGRPVDATFDRSNGCQIERWDRFVPLLPDLSPSLAH
ncbi:Subtilisin inhibitor-like [Streptomyces sp. yr375]|uniref:SSI family serine proteinase inhibitor n=1 Tax=Streptomyces sp. yr375 TaxID=1761906 RepID=UPI0008C33DF5|nr:SSI family serine proteinase inhibitor [Streptomyces sp. yr375]SES44473.1 Subtilisin inhibitor-like [Streptomyces sp. yr375]